MNLAEDERWAGFIEVSWVYTPMQVSHLFKKCLVCEDHFLDLHAHCLNAEDDAHAVLDVMTT